MKAIIPLDIWSNGVTKTATSLSLSISYDDLDTRAALQYVMCDASGVLLAEGQIVIDGETYLTWRASGNSNEQAYAIVASMLNITLE